MLLLQEYRNTILVNSAEGRRYIMRYYVHALEIGRICKRNEVLRNRAAAFIHALAPYLSLALQGTPHELPSELLEMGLSLCDLVDEEASPALHRAIEDLKHDLTAGELLLKLGMHTP